MVGMHVRLCLAVSAIALFACSSSSPALLGSFDAGQEAGGDDAAAATPDATVADTGVATDAAMPDAGSDADAASVAHDDDAGSDAGDQAPDAGPCDASCPSEFNCGTISVCGTTVSCGGACSAPTGSCVHNACACTTGIPDACGDGGACLADDGCGHTLICKNQCALMNNGPGSDAGDAGTPETCDAPGADAGNASWWRYLDGDLFGTIPSDCYTFILGGDDVLCCPPCQGSTAPSPPYYTCPVRFP